MGMQQQQPQQRLSMNAMAPTRVPAGQKNSLVTPQYPKEQTSSGPRLPQKRAEVKPPWEK
jgi:hypothetical protein